MSGKWYRLESLGNHLGKHLDVTLGTDLSGFAAGAAFKAPIPSL